MEKEPVKRSHRAQPYSPENTEDAVQFLLNAVNATIFSSGDDYCGAIEEFFPQVQAIGHLIGARSLEEVSVFMRDHRNW